MMRTRGSKQNLPMEIWEEILSMLPVKSLVRFRSVSKSWRSLIDDPNFSRLHVNNFKDNHRGTHFFLIRSTRSEGREYCVVRCIKTFNIIARFVFPETEFRNPNLIYLRYIQISGSIDGLVMLKNIHASSNKLTLWNPSIDKSRVIHGLTEDPLETHYFDMGMGYDPLTVDYKYVRLAFLHGSLQYVGVYTVGSDSWKKIPYKGKGFPELFEYRANYRKRASLRSCVYVIDAYERLGIRNLVSFDLSAESLTVKSLTIPISDGSYCLAAVDGGRSLALIDEGSAQGSMWVMESSGVENEDVCWTKRYTFPMRIFLFLFFNKNGDVLFWDENDGNVKSYNVETREVKIVIKRRGAFVTTTMLCGYVESLMLLH